MKVYFFLFIQETLLFCFYLHWRFYEFLKAYQEQLLIKLFLAVPLWFYFTIVRYFTFFNIYSLTIWGCFWVVFLDITVEFLLKPPFCGGLWESCKPERDCDYAGNRQLGKDVKPQRDPQARHEKNRFRKGKTAVWTN